MRSDGHVHHRRRESIADLEAQLAAEKERADQGERELKCRDALIKDHLSKVMHLENRVEEEACRADRLWREGWIAGWSDGRDASADRLESGALHHRAKREFDLPTDMPSAYAANQELRWSQPYTLDEAANDLRVLTPPDAPPVCKDSLQTEEPAKERGYVKFSTPCREMTDAQLASENAELDALWTARNDDVGHSGSPGEWLHERSDEISTEVHRRAVLLAPAQEQESGR